MHLAGQTEADLSAWAASRGAAPGGARALARALLAGFAGRPVRELPSGGLVAEARARFESGLPDAETARDADGTVRFAVRLGDGNQVESVAIHQAASELRAAIARAPRTVLLQWTLIASVNDSDREADALAGFARGLDVRVNLIPLNPGPDPSQHAPPLERCRAFQRRLAAHGVRTLLRLPHGQSVGGACGQLAGELRSRAQA